MSHVAHCPLRPLAGRVVVTPGGDETGLQEISSQLLLIPEISKSPPIRGRVVGVGADVYDVQSGDDVLFPAFAGNRHVIENNEYFIFFEHELLAKFTE